MKRAAEPTARGGVALAPCLVVAATYVYFLIFAEFALLRLTQGVAGNLRPLMAVLGASGVAGAVLAALLYAPERATAQVGVAFALCGVAAAAALGAKSVLMFSVVFAVVGLSLGALTVFVAASLRGATTRLGLCVGLGTGVAYALCNLPWVFAASATAQAGVAVASCVVGLVATRFWPRRFDAAVPELKRGSWIGWLVALGALVWFDSAVFYLIQQTPELREAMWSGPQTLAGNAGVHLVFAVVAGWLFDRGWWRLPAVTALGALALASWWLRDVPGAVVPPQWLYTAGVSLYSVLFVAVPASSGRASVAAWVFAVGGWIGSALGIGMAQDLAGVPVAFIVIASTLVLIALTKFARARFGVAVVLLGAIGFTPETRAQDALILRGREVYIREGCMHCHSQFVRPRVRADVERWGPAVTLNEELVGAPPLPGNRRQGPDLLNVGARRSAEWNRLHLIAPREISPGSRMPSYAHLFRGEDSDGDALVLYLATLGAERIGKRLAQVAAWKPEVKFVVSEERARRLFAKSCANCHGAEGRGDGKLAAKLSVRPPDWKGDSWRHVKPGADADVELALSRIIKFGLPGSPMAGHEYLPDEDVVGLARLVRMWHR